MLVRQSNGVEIHVNPRNVSAVSMTETSPATKRYAMETVGGQRWTIDREGYVRLVAWIEDDE